MRYRTFDFLSLEPVLWSVVITQPPKWRSERALLSLTFPNPLSERLSLLDYKAAEANPFPNSPHSSPVIGFN